MEQTTSGFPIADIPSLVSKLRITISQYQITALNRQLEACEQLLGPHASIDVAVLGQFKSGKSSFINSLIGRAILPVGVTPVTTVITRLSHAEQERATVTFFDGSQSVIPLHRLGDYTAESGNPGNRKDVEVVDIELPEFKDYAGLRLVDTPGLGSVFKLHKEVSENWLPEVGAAILAVSADRPLAAHDIELIEDLRQYTPRIILLLTKADLLSPAQRHEVMQFFQQTLIREIGHELPVFLYSTREQTQLFKDRIEAGVLYKIALNRDTEFSRILNHKTQSLLKGCLAYLGIALKSSMALDQDCETLRLQVLNERVSYETVREEIAVISRENQRQTRVLLMHYLERLRQPLTEKLTASLATELPAWRGNLWKLTRRYEAWITETVTEEIRHISETENRHFYGTLKKAHDSLTRAIEAFRMLLNESVQKALGLTLPEAEWKIDVAQPIQPDIKIMYAFDIHFDLLWFIIPMCIFRRLFERHFLGEIPRTVFTNLSRLAAQWEENINTTIDTMRRQAGRYMQDEIATIEALLSNTHGQTNAIRVLINELQNQVINQ